MSNLLKLDFHLFDGGGAGDGAGDGGNGFGAEASAFMQEIGMNLADDATAGAEPTIVYGVEDFSEGSTSGSQLGTDTQAQVQNVDPEAEFAELIGKGGRFEQIYGQHVANAVNQRFKNAEDWEGKVNAYDDALAPLFTKYGLKVGDIEGMAKAIASDDELFSSAAESQGLTVDKYRENLILQAEAEKGRTMLEEIQRQQKQREQFAIWDQQASELTEVFPQFNIQYELQNPDFVAALDRGYSVRDAFMSVHMNEILNGSVNMAAQQTRQSMVENMQRKAARPAENGMRQAAAVVRKSDPSKLTDDDIDKIFNEVETGKQIRF
jgi:hypothetical protein